MSTATCPKCSGSGTVSRFLDYKAGVCFDCNGTGVVTAAIRPGSTGLAAFRDARLVGDAALADPASVTGVDAAAAFEVFESMPRQWATADYDRRNALGRIIGTVLA